jgi:hypothetical protein
MTRFLRLVGYILLPASIAASSCGSDGFMTKGDYCSRLSGPLCNREVACGNIAATDQAACVSGFQSGCCQDDGTCGERATNQQDETALETIITDCTNAASTASCTDLAAGNPPVACGGTSTAYLAAGLPSLKTGVATATPHQMGVTARGRLAPR